MTRETNKLSNPKAKSQLKPGRHSDGAGLYLSVSDSGAKSWLFMWKIAGRRREMGLGSFPAVPLAAARELARAAREHCAAGRDPIAIRDKPKAQSFGEAADELIASMSPKWRNEKHRAQWSMTLSVYAKPLREKPVAEVTTADVLAVLQPIWLSKAETASRLRGRIEQVLDAAKVKGHRSGENPAAWRGHLKHILPERSKLDRGHHTAMAYKQVPAFLATLRADDTVGARALEFTILTAARSGEALGATWAEIDLQASIWKVPESRMKGKRVHVVPLSERAVAILEEMRGDAGQKDFVFPGRRAGRPLSNMVFEMLLRRAKLDVTAHGFRSSFRDWAGNETHFPREIAEAALAHLVGDETERAYRRDTAIAKRRELMNAWALHCEGNLVDVDKIASLADYRGRV